MHWTVFLKAICPWIISNGCLQNWSFHAFEILYPFEKTSLKWIPRSKPGASKSRPRWAAHTCISNLWEYPHPHGFIRYPGKMKMWRWILYEFHILELWNEEMNAKKIIAVKDVTRAVEKRKPEKFMSCVFDCGDLLHIYFFILRFQW